MFFFQIINKDIYFNNKQQEQEMSTYKLQFK